MEDFPTPAQSDPQIKGFAEIYEHQQVHERVCPLQGNTDNEQVMTRGVPDGPATTETLSLRTLFNCSRPLPLAALTGNVGYPQLSICTPLHPASVQRPQCMKSPRLLCYDKKSEAFHLPREVTSHDAVHYVDAD